MNQVPLVVFHQPASLLESVVDLEDDLAGEVKVDTEVDFLKICVHVVNFDFSFWSRTSMILWFLIILMMS